MNAAAAPWQMWERAILDHLAAHPHAADSAAGVTRWWLGADAEAAADVEHALDQLVARGLLRRVLLTDGTALYAKDTSEPRH